MKNVCVAALVLLVAACASSPGYEPETMPAPQPAADPRVNELQTQLTELLERIDVLNQRISQLEETSVGTPASVSSSQGAEQAASSPPRRDASAPSTPPEPQRALVSAQIADDYRQAIILFGRGKHGDARSTFQTVFDADPSGDLADNAIFWIGETYFAARDYTNAVRFYQRVVSDYPTQNKAPDALFKIAMAQERTGDLALARRTLEQVIERYPYSSLASSAKAELQRIRY